LPKTILLLSIPHQEYKFSSTLMLLQFCQLLYALGL
jgi:hypothetical protein